MNYEIKMISEDEFNLKYTDKNGEKKNIKFKRTVEIAKELEEITANARLRMFKDFAKKEMTKDDLIIKRDDGKGKIIYDETNYQLVEKGYIAEEALLVADKIYKKLFGFNTFDLMKEMGVDPYSTDKKINEQAKIFARKISYILRNGKLEETPSK